jgi:hypothetical protein
METLNAIWFPLHKEVPFAGYLAQWACLAVSLPIQKSVEQFFLGVYHQNNLWVVIIVLYFLLCNLVTATCMDQYPG